MGGGFYPRVQVDTAPVAAVTQAGGVTLTETVTLSGLGGDLKNALGLWRKQYAVHDPAKVLLDLALTLALGGERLADAAVIRAEPALYGLMASDPTISRTIDALAPGELLVAELATPRVDRCDMSACVSIPPMIVPGSSAVTVMMELPSGRSDGSTPVRRADRTLMRL